MEKIVPRTKSVYVPMAVDIIHPGHINVISHAASVGSVTVGLLTDSAIASYKRVPLMSYDQRMRIVESIKGVDQVVAQDSWDYTVNLRRLKPDFMVHADDWVTGVQAERREECLVALAEWGGELIEPTYTPGISSTQLLAGQARWGITPDARLSRLRRLIEVKPLIRILEAHNGLSALIVESMEVERGGTPLQFDAVWSSSLTDSTSRGKPDIEAVDISSRLSTTNEIFEVTTKPMVFDGDTGGRIEHLPFTVRSLERLGVSAIVIEDKEGLKRNSLFGNEANQVQADPEDFGRKIAAAKLAQVTEDFMVVARIESLILEQGLADALSRARIYVGAGADAVLIHSKSKSPSEVMEFSRAFRSEFPSVPIIAVPSTYREAIDTELAEAGVNVLIYANHMLRAAYPSMRKVAESILLNGRSLEAEELLEPIPSILTLVPGNQD
jgi:phosphoenolpyruvate phosphomutase